MDILNKFQSVKVYIENNKPSLHKPVLLLFALSQCYKNYDRLIPFIVIDEEFNKIFCRLSLDGRAYNSFYPFGKLENDGIWVVTESNALKRTSAGHLFKKELIDKRICGGFTEQIYKVLSYDKKLLLLIVDYFLNRYFTKNQRIEICTILEFPISSQVTMSLEYSNSIGGVVVNHKNGYIAYLNSLHNVNASGANALAESQALNRYFTEIYEPFPIIDALFDLLRDKRERVVVLTGHAGDGKSTIAFDVLKRLRNLPTNECIDKALSEQEDILNIDPQVFIIKDMSELTAQQRLNSLVKGFNEPGSWLIVSNTGPLLNSLEDYRENYDGPDNIESNILELLEKPYLGGDLDLHSLVGFKKELVIINITRLDNVAIGSRVLTRMVKHTAWEDCNGCEILKQCPLRLNREALKSISAIVEERVRWVYQYLTAYEQRLTLRQMIAHLAFSLTSGISCDNVRASVCTTVNNSPNSIDGLESMLFSESFFGYRIGNPWPASENLSVVALLKRSIFGGPTAVDFERQLLVNGSLDGLTVPDVLQEIQLHWLKNAIEAKCVTYRYSLRRMLYFFGHQSSKVSEHSEMFLNTFLHSPMLKKFDSWQNGNELKLNDDELRKLKKICLQVLLEFYSGFSAGQLQDHDCLYLTLRRFDGISVQPTQLVIAKLSNDDFSLEYNNILRFCTLCYRPGKVELKLTLPLLDYIHARSNGSLGNKLAPIHSAQLEWFRAELLKASSSFSLGEISLLRSGVEGKVRLYRYVVDAQKNRLEKYT